MQDFGKFAFKLRRHTQHQGIPLAIETDKGEVRKGVDKDGKPWRTVMKHPYGYIKGSKGADGEEVDAYLGPAADATHAFVVHQRKSDGKGYDEDKVMLGFPSKEEAVKGYLVHYNSEKFLGPVKPVPIERLREMLMSKKKLVKISALSTFAEVLSDRALLTFYKEASLSDDEATRFKELLRERSEYEQASRKGIDDTLHKKMLHNGERLKHFQNKKRDPTYAIPSWVKDRKAEPPSGTFHRRGPKSEATSRGAPGGSAGRGRRVWSEEDINDLYQESRRHHAEQARRAGEARRARAANDWEAARKEVADRVKRDAHWDDVQTPKAPRSNVPLAAGAVLGGMAARDFSRNHKDRKSFIAKNPNLVTAAGSVAGAGLAHGAHKLLKAASEALWKMGEITEEQARRSLDRYETLESQQPTGKQVARYAALGALAGPASHVVGNVARGKGLKGAVDAATSSTGKALSHGKLRTIAGTAASGALATGVVPLVRTHLDRSAERGTLKKYMNQDKEKDSAMTGHTPARPWAANESADWGKYGFAMSQYSSGMGSPRFKQTSHIPPFRAPSLASTVDRPPTSIVEKLGMGGLAGAKAVGLPKVTAPAGPAIADQVPTFGRRLPGANKTVIGKGL